MKLTKEQEQDYKEVMSSLRKWRLENKWGLRDFATKLDINVSKYSRVENCFPKLEKFTGFGCTLKDGCKFYVNGKEVKNEQD